MSAQKKQRINKQKLRGESDAIRGNEHKDGRGKHYDSAYSDSYAQQEMASARYA